LAVYDAPGSPVEEALAAGIERAAAAIDAGDAKAALDRWVEASSR
jgi:anthranilate phosphoribosyltransferase